MPIQNRINVWFIVDICSPKKTVDKGEETKAGSKEDWLNGMGESPGFRGYNNINETHHSNQTMAREVLKVKRMSSWIIKKGPVN